MIEKILKRLSEERIKEQEFRSKRLNENALRDANDAHERIMTLNKIEEIVQEVAKEYGNASDNDLAVVSALPSLYPLQKFEEEAIHKVVASAKNGGWIPVEVAMPTEKGWYRVTCEDNNIWTSKMVRDLYYYPTIKCFIDNIRYSEHGCNDIMKYDWTKYVTAWKPKDAPYQKGE